MPSGCRRDARRCAPRSLSDRRAAVPPRLAQTRSHSLSARESGNRTQADLSRRNSFFRVVPNSDIVPRRSSRPHCLKRHIGPASTGNPLRRRVAFHYRAKLARPRGFPRSCLSAASTLARLCAVHVSAACSLIAKRAKLKRARVHFSYRVVHRWRRYPPGVRTASAPLPPAHARARSLRRNPRAPAAPSPTAW